MLAAEKPGRGFILLDEAGLLEIILPELCQMKGIDSVRGIKHKDNFLHTLEVLDNLAGRSENIWLYLIH